MNYYKESTFVFVYTFRPEATKVYSAEKKQKV